MQKHILNFKEKSLSFAIGFWCFSRMFFEDLCKIVDIHDAAMLGDGLNLQFGCGQKMFCQRYSSLVINSTRVVPVSLWNNVDR